MRVPEQLTTFLMVCSYGGATLFGVVFQKLDLQHLLCMVSSDKVFRNSLLDQ